MRKLIVVAAAISALPFAASAQQPTSQTLSCSGTYSMDNGQHFYSYPQGAMSIVMGNDSISMTGYSEVPITQATQTKVDFSGEASASAGFLRGGTSDVSGSIDLVTGQTKITIGTSFNVDKSHAANEIMRLTCAPAH